LGHLPLALVAVGFAGWSMEDAEKDRQRFPAPAWPLAAAAGF